MASRASFKYIFWATVLVVLFQNCGAQVGLEVVSPPEQAALDSSTVFANPPQPIPDPPPKQPDTPQPPTDQPVDPNTQVAGVVGSEGIPSEGLRVNSIDEAARSFVKDCSAPVRNADGVMVSRYNQELNEALQAADDDPDQKTIPVQFAISFGTINDVLARYAHRRAILTENNDGASYIPVAPKKSPYISENPHLYGYYIVDHQQAKLDYVYGRKCFFGTVRIKELKTESSMSFIKDVSRDSRHQIQMMYLGFCGDRGSKCATESSVYGPGYYGSDSFPNRLFGKWPHREKSVRLGNRPQIVKLYVADIRASHINISSVTARMSKGMESKNRGEEWQLKINEILNMKELFRQRDQIVLNLSQPFEVPGNSFEGMVGVPQLLSNLLQSQVSQTLLASQYTPIVLDLGHERIHTTSIFGGSYFNMTALQDPKSIEASERAFDYPHATAWLGGPLVNAAAASTKSIPFPMDVRRESEDGFLVVPDKDGDIHSSRNLFGEKMAIQGKSYRNGFEALISMTNKDCSSTDIKKRYFGPWDGDLYNEKIKIWIDRNRNGTVNNGEVQTLKQSGVVAINTCHIVHSEAVDVYGNNTALRSAFLYQEGEDITGNEAEIEKRIRTGKTSDGRSAQFRLMVDVFFKALPDKILN